MAARMENGLDSSFRIESDALVDTGAAYLTLPAAWRDRLGPLAHLDTISVETATQAVVSGDICGPVLLRMGEFRPVITEALFIEMEPAEGRYEPLIGYIPLEQAQAVVDLAGRRLAKFGRVDLKAAPATCRGQLVQRSFQDAQALGRSRGGFSCKLHVACTEERTGLRFALTGGERH